MFFSPPKMALPTWGSTQPHTAGAGRRHVAAKLLTLLEIMTTINCSITTNQH